jgi:tripartite-type tricarboxylate transporter receptor subunit TctC
MKKIILSLMVAVTTFVSAAEYNIYIPLPPGSAGDAVGRAISKKYEENTGNKLVPLNVPGGNMLIAVNAFKNQPKSVLLNNTSILMFNQKMLDSVNYTDADFDHVGYLSVVPGVWVTREDTQYKTLKDVIEKMPGSKNASVGFGFSGADLANAQLVQRQYKWNPETVKFIPYNGGPAVVLALMRGDIDVAMVSVSVSLVEQVKAGKLRVLATTLPEQTTIAGITIQPVKKLIGAEQVNGGSFLSINPKINPDEAKKLKKDLMDAAKSPEVIEVIKQAGTVPVMQDADAMKEFVAFTRKQLEPLQIKAQQ